MNKDKKNSILIIGGGLIGLSLAYEFARKNFEVEVLSKNRSESAGFVAAGMLAAHAEGLENELLDFGRYSQSLIPEWINNIQKDSGIDCGLKKCGIIVPFENISDLNKFPTFKNGQYLNKHEMKKELEGLDRKWQHGLLFEQDGQIDNRRRLMRALERGCTIHGVKFQEGAEIKEIIYENGIFLGVRVSTATGEINSIFCKKAILCCGAWCNQILSKIPIRPVKGQMLSIQGPINKFKRIIFGQNTYLVPRDDGLIIVGATLEKEAGFNKGNTPEGIKKLQAGIKSLYPEAKRWPHMEHWWGFRPATPDLKPIIGKSSVKNLFLATGHYRNGVLFSAATSNLIYKLICEGNLNDLEQKFLEKFKLERFV
tara:strand:+ start:7197 stop:8303 length:1107 start_codon:yes stop_codon:yes gene_type:complete